MKKAVLIAFDKFTDVDIFLPWDLFNRVKLIHKGFEVKILGTAKSHRSICGLEVATQGFIEEANDADIVFFGSGAGARKLIDNQAYLQRFDLNPEEQIICSMCSGALLLAALGHLEGVPATTYPTVFEKLRNMGVNVLEDTHLVTYGNIGTAAGCLAVTDLIKWALTKIYDQQTAEDVIASVLPVGQGQVCIY